MLFNSLSFLIFFPVVVLLYYAIPKRFRYIWLLVASYYFYMSWNAKYAILLFISTFATYLTALGLDRYRVSQKEKGGTSLWRGKLMVALCVVINLGILFYFKYANFTIELLNRALNLFHMQIPVTVDVVLPVGISFYTFQALGYMIDVYRGDVEVEHNFFRYALFVSFFPQLVAGPIERSKNLLTQLREDHPFDFENVKEGLLLMVWGFFLKLVIAERAAVYVDAVYADMTTYSGFYVVMAAILFAFQIYCDFGGYSTIAMGAAKVMGIQLMDNFEAPYFSRSVGEFWRRWHISLNTWFRDYVYIPLGGSRKGKFRKYVNTMIVFLLSGLWHGASLHFVVWGGINGLNIVIGDLLMPVRNRLQKLLGLNRDSISHKLYQMVFTFVLSVFMWVFFRADSLKEALKALQNVIFAANPWILFDGTIEFAGDILPQAFRLLWLCIGILLAADVCKYRGIKIRKVLAEQELWFRWLVGIAGVLAVLVFGLYGYGYDAQSFIYFQF
jgi:D-alanyl-lipoteichoic acid acyltransferase DltB (MBOAT superfamily)